MHRSRCRRLGTLFAGLLLLIATCPAMAAADEAAPPQGKPGDQENEGNVREPGPPPGRGPGFRGGRGRGFQGGRGAGFQGGPGRGRGGGPPGDERFAADRDVFHYLLENHEKIRRTVKQRPDGVETLTESEDPRVAQAIQDHVHWMKQRVEKIQPIRMRDPLFAEVFRHAEKIEMKYEKTPRGVKVTETSRDPYVAELIKAHAGVVSGFVAKGFEEAHKAHAVPADARAKAAAAGQLEQAEGLAAIFAGFDRAYIPALALTKMQKDPAARQAVQRLQRQWQISQPEILKAVPEADQQAWKRSLAKVNNAVARAGRQAEAGELAAAHETLELVRDVLLERRTDSGVHYALDVLNQFHITMERIVKPAGMMKPEEFNASTKQRFQKLQREAVEIWSAVNAAELQSPQLALGEKQRDLLVPLIRAQGEALERLGEALQQDDAERILEAARAIKPGFARIYMLFGEFPDGMPPGGKPAG